MLPEAENYAVLYHRSYKVNTENFRKRMDWKKLKKKCGKARLKQKKVELLFENDVQCAPEIELPSNASAFAVFASVRLAVLDRWMRSATQEHLQSSCSMPLVDQSEFESDTEDNSQSSTYVPVKVSKVVGLGLRSVFELIKESRTSHPVLCCKALLALLDVLQGQTPEGLKSEPLDVIDPLFELLLDLATLHGPESSVANDGSHLTAVACACLLSLVVVRGDTGKYLSAAAALLMCPRALSVQNILMPAVLSSLQRSVHGVLLGKMLRPDWHTHGVPVGCRVDSFHMKIPGELLNVELVPKSLAFDGQYLYLFTSRGLFKIGSGYGGTVKGHVSVWKPDFYPNDNGGLVFCSGKLYLKLCGRRGGEFLIVERSNLLICGSVPLHSRDVPSSVIFCDGDFLGTISAAKDDGFVVRLLNQNTAPASLVSELPLKLARKCVETLGYTPFEDEGSYFVSINTEEEIATICAGKEFGLVRTVTGKVFHSGKASALGIKQAGVRTGKWSELVLNKSPKIAQIAMGHEGLHAVFITDDGAVLFAGTARRGEDGDQNKVRRQPKPVKPKKMIKVDGLCIAFGACNNGTTALVTRDGEVLMFGKDTAHADASTGLVAGLKGEFITQIALGKAHAIALTSKGQVYTFGINNKFQCGREFVKQPNKDGTSSHVVAMDTGPVQEEQDYFEDMDAQPQKDSDNMAGSSEGNVGEEGQLNMCPAGAHAWHEDMCMVCTVCRECTGYSISCLSSMSSERNPGQECGCGEGDSGCAICGCCRICAREVVDNSELADLAGMMRDNKLIPSKQPSKLQEHLQSRLEERKNKSKKSLVGSSKQTSKQKSSLRSSVLATPTHKANNVLRQNNLLGTVKEQTGSDVERDAARVACLPPAKLVLPSDSAVIQIACGLHHSVLLLQNGQVFTFGSNLYGQLGCGDILAKNNVQYVKLPTSAVHVAAGSNHTVILTSKGEVFTFGNSEKGQLGRLPSPITQESSYMGQSSTSKYGNPRNPWYSIPGAVPNVGPKYGRRATWVGASGDQTFLKLDESLINSVSIAKSIVTANKQSIVLFPNQEMTSRNFKCLVINKKDGNCNSFKGPDQADFASKMVCMDPIYNILWSYDASNHEVCCYNVIVSELQTASCNSRPIKTGDNRVLSDIKIVQDKSLTDKFASLSMILSPELALPLSANCHVTRFQAALNLLCCLDTLTIAHDLQISGIKEEVNEQQMVTGKQYCKEDFQAVNRFESHGGGWGYSGHSIEAIRFMADTDILMGGFGLFGGRGEYTAKLKLLDIGPNGGEQEVDGELLAETEEVPYECGPRQKYAMLFDEPLQLQAHRWYVAWCRISGPSSDCGSSGQTMVTTEDQVLFYFKSSKKSNNGTDVNAGQIPQLLYKIVSPENQSPPRQVDIVEPIHILTKEFSRTVTKECFQSLLSLLQWSWNTFKWGIMEGQSIKNMYTSLELERLVYISTSSLRLLCTYTNEIYPRQINSHKVPLENVHLAECIGDVRSLLKQILSDNIPLLMQNKKSSKTKTYSVTLMRSILQECHNTFVSCFHAFYPTAYLKWTCLCDLLAETSEAYNPHSSSNTQMLLSAVLCALCAPSVRLRTTFPLLGLSQSMENSLQRGLSPSDNTGHPMMSVSDSHNYPILVEQMSYKSQVESNYSELSWTWLDVLDRLMNLVSDPIVRVLQKQTTVCLSDLSKYCCHLLARVLAELVHQCSSSDEDLQGPCGRILHMTPSRFTRTNQSRTWNTGNGSPDAICFQVDRPGISIVGVGIYGGIGHYEYELELLEDTSLSSGLENHAAHRWNSLEITRGSFGPEDFAPDVVEIKFDRAVPIKENNKYGVRLRNHGGRTNNGDGGLNSVKGSDNTTFTFSTCSISFNGTTLTRGQLPIILYYSNPIEGARNSTSKLENQARKTALSMTGSIVQNAAKLMMLAREKVEEVASASILSDSCVVKNLLPLMLAHISPLASSDPKSAVQVLSFIQELLPHVSALNLLGTPNVAALTGSHQESYDNKMTTTSNHSTWVESEHPYKAATVANYRVLFPDSVKWMSLEFDVACATAQPEDSLQLYIPAIDFAANCRRQTGVEDTECLPLPYWSVLHKFSGNLQWPSNSVILPGNEVVFSLETASDYVKDDRASSYGFKCLVTGYEWPPDTASYNCLKHLEAELSFLGGMCAASLMKKDLLLPSVGDEGEIDMEAAETVSVQIYTEHSSLLAKGLALSSSPSVSQALEGMLPYSAHSNERLFLRDFVNCVSGSSGGRLAQWLQPGSRAEPSLCRVICAREDLRQGWPTAVTVLTRDQYGEAVFVPNMKVEVRAIPIEKSDLGQDDGGRKMRRVSQPDPLVFGGLPPPPLHHPYEPTVRDKMRFNSITVMKPFQNYSFEEIRYTSPPTKRSSETMLVRPNMDGSYSATWTPTAVGCYSIAVTIDGYEMEETFKVEVKEPPQGMIPPNQNTSKKSSHQPSKVRKFVAKNSAGLRVRAHPSLQSEQIGVVHVNGTIVFIDEIHNDDGVWLRLSADTIRQYCNPHVIEAWCLQYNQHLGKTLLLPVEEPKSILEQVITDTIMRKLPEIQNKSRSSQVSYKVIKCGASGHNVRSRPSLKAPPVGMLVLGNRIGVSEYVVNSEGCWVLLDNATKEKYCFNMDGEAWSLAIGINNVLYLDNVNEADDPKVESPKRGFQFQYPKPSTEFTFSNRSSSSTIKPEDLPSSNPFVFGENSSGDPPRLPKREKRAKFRPKLHRSDGQANEGFLDEFPRQDSGSNGNGITPPDTPKRSQSPRQGSFSPKPLSRSSSPIALPNRVLLADSNTSAIHGSSKSPGISQLASAAGPEGSRRGSNQSDTSSLTRDLSQSPSQLRGTTPSPSGSCVQISPQKKDYSDTDPPPRKLTQTGTQTSPENAVNPPVRNHFSIGSVHREEKLSPKMMRKDRSSSKTRTKRAMSPANMPQLPKANYQSTEPVKQAMSPSVAEALRAVFAAFLWHEGIVHDAMACASFLKFHPTLPKQGAQVVTRHDTLSTDRRRRELTKEERARQRHSVEVSNAGNYLHIQPSTLESLTRSAANANANRNRSRKITDGTINEESGEHGYTYQTVSVLPPALKSLVFLWEELTTSCLQNMNEQMSPKNKSKKQEKMDAKEKNNTIEKESKKSKKKKVPPRNYLEDIGLCSYLHSSNGDTLCELCGDSFPHPVTYHMHQEHPGCGQHAGGKGYNSGGNYCLGWAGNCGDGGVPGSSWYLLCEQCREKYTKSCRGNKPTSSKAKAVVHRKPSKAPSTISSGEPHVVMKNNAMFLLDLANSADSQRRASNAMPSVSENVTPPDCTGPFGPLPPFQCFQTLGGANLFDESDLYNEVLHGFYNNSPRQAPSTSTQRPLSEVSLSESESDVIRGTRFHRSVSMGTNGIPWAKAGFDGRVIMMRRRNNSGSEMAGEGGSSLLCNPSPALQRLLPKEELTSVLRNDAEPRESLNLAQRPVLQFVVQHHDLDSLRICMKQALRKAMCRVYAMQALNWLLRSVTQPLCLHDLLWWFVTSLTPIEIEAESEEDNRPPKKPEEDLNVCEHPLSDITIAGDSVHPLPATFHALLQTIAHIMVLLPMGSPLQQIAVRCWGLRFASADHSFLHRSQVFSNISKILSRSEELDDFTVSMHESAFNQPTASVECLKDLSQSVEIRASSRQAMIASLTDGSTETFWESGDEDRNKTKSITVICAHGHHPVLVCVHVDNCRDLGNKISTIAFFSGQNTDELLKLRTVEVETRLLGGWVSCPITEVCDNVIKLELKGPDNSVRLRQIRILGKVEGECLKVGKLYSAATIHQRNCEAETLRVFRLITAQVFGKLLQGEECASKALIGDNSSPSEIGDPLEESNDLREHMVGILFSRSKLTHLQKQVIVHIVQAIRKETERVKDEWECNLCTSSTVSSHSSSEIAHNSDTYCFEMLSMVLALSGSAVGRAYLSHQGGLLGDLLTLLHTGSARVQRQVTSLLRRMLPEITPEFFAKIVGVSELPPKDFNFVSVVNKDVNNFKFDINRTGILDIFLSVIAKNLTVQVKMRSKSGNGAASKEVSTVTITSSIQVADDVGQRWWLRGTSNRKMAEVMVQLITDMSGGKMSEIWANITKGAIAENILNLTCLTDEQRTPSLCLKTPTLWLALASLCVLDKDHVERLSSGQWSQAEGNPMPPRPMCSNHDDGETTAVIQCNICGNLCADCDRFLHLHRKTRAHLRQVCKEEEEAIKVELHEGCGRTKLFWLLALADSRTLKALVEYREGGARSRAAGVTGICRFCGTTGNSGLLAIGNVCADSECQEYGKTACMKLLNCGHMCGGASGETQCLPCLHGCSNDSSLRQDSDDMCMICFTEALSCAPAIQLQCGHVFHLHCCKAVLMKRWAGPRITFSFSLCPICKVNIQHPTLGDLLRPIQELYKDVRRKALMRLEYEGLQTVEAVVTPGARFYNDTAAFAMDRYAYYVCYKCGKAYYGGEARCDAEAGDVYDPAELVCGACSDVARAQMCPKHGADFLEYKCRYCCSVAVFFCFGTTHFCNPCHDDFQRVTNLTKAELPACPAGPRAMQLEGDECPLHVKHPATGEEFALGCGVCRNAHTF